MDEQAQVRNISHIHLNCSDFRASVAFYQLLGFEVDRIINDDFTREVDTRNLDTVPLISNPEGDVYTLTLGVGQGEGKKKDPRAITRLELMQWETPRKQAATPPPEQRLGMVRIALTVEGLETIIQRVKAAGHRCDETETIQLSPTLSSRYAHIYDPDGNWLTLMEWLKTPNAS